MSKILLKYNEFCDTHDKITNSKFMSKLYKPAMLSKLLAKFTCDNAPNIKYGMCDFLTINNNISDTTNIHVLQAIHNYLMHNLTENNTIGIVVRHKYNNLKSEHDLIGFDKDLCHYLMSTKIFSFDFDVVVLYDQNCSGKHTFSYFLLNNKNLNDIDICFGKSANFLMIQSEQFHKTYCDVNECEYTDGVDIYTNIVLLFKKNNNNCNYHVKSTTDNIECAQS